MVGRLSSAICLGVLTLSGAAVSAASDDAESLRHDMNAARRAAYKYFIQYREKYGFALRTQAMLKACDMTELAAQLDGDLPQVAVFAAERFTADPESKPPELFSQRDMTMSVAIATQTLTEGYTLGYMEAFKGEPQSCGAVGKVYNDYLKSKTKAKAR
jgi:hypothetical protein